VPYEQAAKMIADAVFQQQRVEARQR